MPAAKTMPAADIELPAFAPTSLPVSGLFRVLASTLALLVAGPAIAQTQNRAETESRNRIVAETRRQAEGGGTRVVLELFTSQGCSACPPADALLGRLAARSDVIALTLAVDYWDYLGWKDTLASPAHSKRQRAYAKHRGDGMVYTPQVVVHGRQHVNGARADAIDAAITAVRAQSVSAEVELKVRGERGGIVVDVGARSPNGAGGAASEVATLWLALVERKVEVPIRSGENRGKRITYVNVVRSLRPIGNWSGTAQTIRLEGPAPSGAVGGQGAFVLLQSGPGGPILAAAELAPRRQLDPTLADEKR